MDAWTETDERRYAELLAAQYNAEPLMRFIGRVNPRFPPPPHLEQLTELFEETRHREVFGIVGMPPRHRKLVADSTPVLTPDGWRTHGDLAPGDLVYAPDGTPTRIIGITAKDLATREVEFSDGERIRVNPEHRWGVWERGSGFVVRDTAHIEARITSGRCANGAMRARYQVDWARPLQNPAIDLPIDPWVFGLWLGDGTTGNGRITAGSADVGWVMSEVMRRGYSIGSVNIHGDTGVVTFCTLGMRIRSVCGLEKYIPDVYFRASEDQRRDLLRGLVDSDGSVGVDGRVRFVNTDRRLAEGVRDLVHTLGYRACVDIRPPGVGGVGPNGSRIVGTRDAFVVSWTPTDGARQALMPRKDVCHSGMERRRSIVAIRPCEPEPGHCLQVEHPSHMYLVGRHQVPTHNSTTCLNGLAHQMVYDPALFHAYLTYNDRQAQKMSRLCHSIASAADVRFNPGRQAVSEWRTRAGGGLYASSVGGSLTGVGVTGVMLIDDPFKDRKEADSEKIRQTVWEWFTDVAMTRLERGSSVIIVMTRWHEDDLAGRLLRGELDETCRDLGIDPIPWQEVKLAAICEDEDDGTGREIGEALWPQVYDRTYLLRRRALNPWSFEALYQQAPRPRHGRLFGEPARYGMHEFLLNGLDGCRIVIGADTALSDDKKADHTAGIVLAAKGWGADMVGWVLDVSHGQWDPPTAAERLHDVQAKWGGPLLAVEGGPAGKAAIASLRRLKTGMRFIEVPPVGDKYTRAQGAAAAWNAGRLRIPLGYPWSDGLIKECQSFTGVEGGQDDRVDALAHAWNILADVNSHAGVRELPPASVDAMLPMG